MFDDGLVSLPRRFGLIRMKPMVHSLVLVSNNARIGRPGRPIKGLDEVIKAEKLRTALYDAFDAAPNVRMSRLIGKDALAKFARELAGLHRPASYDWAARFGLSEAPSVALDAPVATVPALPEKARPRGSDHRCARCGVGVSFAVVKFCWNNKARFGDAVYCMECQWQFK